MQNNRFTVSKTGNAMSDSPDNLSATLECLLFASGETISINDLAKITDCENGIVESGLRELSKRLDECGSGLQLVELAGGWQLATRPQFSHSVGRLIAPNAHKLTRPALETITIIAYRQPCTQSEIEAIRGVSCGGILKTLEERSLIQIAGRKPTPGRPILYATTDAFLHHFGLRTLGDLPRPEEDEQPALPFEADTALSAAGMQTESASIENGEGRV